MSEAEQKYSEPKEENFGYDHERIFVDGPSRESVCEAETASTTFNSDRLCNNRCTSVDGVRDLNGAQESKHTANSCSGSGVEDERSFTFSVTSASGQGSSSFRKHILRKKNKVKTGNASFIITPSSNVKEGYSSVQFSHCDPVQSEQKDKPTYHSKEENKNFNQGSNSNTVSVDEACEMWRLRGNQAYRNDNLSKAEEFYTRGINSVPSNETLRCSIKPLVLCYSNRAATRISLGRMREALADCLMASALDPNFLEVYARGAK
ncbi:TPR repeat-containing thioredoxin TTL2-like [Hibiscus syriacus]|nr:TPR repeat-containing thioredoxin TTL2-like [Hibiscus syriacus]